MPLLNFADIDAQCARYEQLKREDIAILEEWQRKQPYLPAPLHPIESALFLHKCRYNIEAAKQRIDMYYTYRTRFPEFFSNRDPFNLDVQRFLDSCLIIVLPECTPDGCMVFYSRLLNESPQSFTISGYLKSADMIIEVIQKQRGCPIDYIAILDLEGSTVSHALKCNVLSIKKYLLYVHKGLPIRLKSLHFVNSVPFVDKFATLVRPFLGNEYRIKAHFGDNSTIFDFVPQEILPVECGGKTFRAIDYYQNVSRKMIENNAEYFKREEERLVDEAKRVDKMRNIDNFLGVEGTFKKLNVD